MSDDVNAEDAIYLTRFSGLLEAPGVFSSQPWTVRREALARSG